MIKSTIITLTLLLGVSPALAEKLVDSDTTWKAGASPVSVSEDTTVVAGVTLTIEPGVFVELGEGKSLTIKGTLLARGTATKTITFTGKKDTSGKRARWGSLVFADESKDAVFKELDEYQSGSIVEHCAFENATRAIQIVKSSPYVHKCAFTDNLCTYTKNNQGGAALKITGGSAPRVYGNTFTNNVGKSLEGGAVFVDSSSPIFQDNTFTKNSSGYGGALTTYHVYSPLVGNTFSDNSSTLKGGAVALISSGMAFLNNKVTGNKTATYGGGIHVCTDCNPHANPFFMDNTITGNSNTLHVGTAGIGASFLRVFSHNNIHGNNRTGQGPNDFGWYHELSWKEPAWTQTVKIPHNYWGTTDTKKIADMIMDGNDEAKYGKVSTFLPVRSTPVTTPETRVTITTRRAVFKTQDDPMPVYLTVYNPGAARKVDLLLMIGYGSSPPVYYRGKVDFPGVTREGRAFKLALPKNSVYFTRLLQTKYPGPKGLPHGFWHAALYDSATGKRIGDISTIRFDLSK